jgi:predicted small lipoprotein YifL
MKVKILCVMMASLFFFSLAACGKKGPLKPIAEKKTMPPHSDQQKK